MKFKNGRDVKIGDIAIKRNTDGTISGGVVVGGYNDYLSLATFGHSALTPGQTMQPQSGTFISVDTEGKASTLNPWIMSSQNAAEFLHADDALKAFEKLESALP